MDSTDAIDRSAESSRSRELRLGEDGKNEESSSARTCGLDNGKFGDDIPEVRYYGDHTATTNKDYSFSCAASQLKKKDDESSCDIESKQPRCFEKAKKEYQEIQYHVQRPIFLETRKSESAPMPVKFDLYEASESSRIHLSHFQWTEERVNSSKTEFQGDEYSLKQKNVKLPGNHFDEKKMESRSQHESQYRVNLETRNSESAPIPVEYVLSEKGGRNSIRSPNFQWNSAVFLNKFRFPLMNKKRSINPYIKLRDELRGSSSSSTTNAIRVRNLSLLDIISQDKRSSSSASSHDKYFTEIAKESIHSTGHEGSSSTISRHGVPVAKAICDEPIYAALEYDPSSKLSLLKNRRFQAYSAFALLVICSVTVIAVIYLTKQTKEFLSIQQKIQYQLSLQL